VAGFSFLTLKQKNIVVPFLRKCKTIKKFITVILIITVIAPVIGGFFWWQWATGAIAPEIKTHPPAERAGNSKLKTEEIFVIRRGESLNSIAKRLKKEELIRSSLAFKIIVYTQGLVGKIQAGSFRLGSFLTPFEIATTLTHGTADVWLTFPEGWRKEEFARRLAANLENFDEQEFLALTGNLEGYLFPDTYLVPKTASPSAIIKILTNNFEKKTKDLKISRQELILASIVEREAKYDHDRPIVAGILIKRWQAGWPLQTDATVQYAVATKQFSNLAIKQSSNFDWWPELKKEDLKIDSPYNTYKYRGLPPTPICNPGFETIKAVLNPTPTDYWYYLSGKDGNIRFAKTLKEHQENIAKYLK
jgi:UPF0755 protein